MRAGALKVLVTTSSRSDVRSTVVRFVTGAGSLSLLASINLLLPFQFLDNLLQPLLGFAELRLGGPKARESFIESLILAKAGRTVTTSLGTCYWDVRLAA
jgi:hypothetical protein